MSIKLRMTLWFTLMVLLLAAMVLVFVLVINANAVTDDPAGRLVKVVMKNSDRLEFEHGRFEWDDVDAYSRGVYSAFYNDSGELLNGAEPEGFDSATLSFEPNVVRGTDISGKVYYVYDVHVNMDFSGIWVRGLISADDRSGLMHTILILTATLLPALIVLSVAGGWLIAKLSFRPLEKIVSAANDISDGGDLTRRLNIKHGPSEMKRLGSSFDRMFARLEESFNVERQFASDASHELRTPVTIILAQCDRSKRKDKTREDFLASIGVIEEQGKHMSELVQQLLGLTRLQHGTDRYPMREGDLSGFTESCCGEFVPADCRGIELETDIAPDVSARFNSALMSRVIYNLLQNAYKYGKEGGHIWLKLSRTDEGAVLSVKDDGIGIAPEDLDKVWQRFWQADASRGDEGSSGLGLSMVREIALFHSGRAEVESVPGQGSTFRIILPFRPTGPTESQSP